MNNQARHKIDLYTSTYVISWALPCFVDSGNKNCKIYEHCSNLDIVLNLRIFFFFVKKSINFQLSKWTITEQISLPFSFVKSLLSDHPNISGMDISVLFIFLKILFLSHLHNLTLLSFCLDI